MAPPISDAPAIVLIGSVAQPAFFTGVRDHGVEMVYAIRSAYLESIFTVLSGSVGGSFPTE